MEDDELDPQNGLENKMLYELHNIHTWEKSITEIKPSLKDVTLVSAQQIFLKLSSTADTSFLAHGANPSVSHDGEFLALISNTSVQIRDKDSSYSILAEIDIPPPLLLEWSLNSNHIALSEIGDEIQVYDPYGKVLNKRTNVGKGISTFSYWFHEGFNFIIVSSDHHMISYYENKENLFNFELSEPLSGMLCTSFLKTLVTTHQDNNSLTLKYWNVDAKSDDGFMQLYNKYVHNNISGSVKDMIQLHTPLVCCLEKTSEKYILVLNNYTRMLSVHFLPSLAIAKIIKFTQIPDLDPKEHVVDAGWWSEDIIAILSSQGKVILVPFKTLDIMEAENFQAPSIFIPSPLNSVFVLEQSDLKNRKDILNSVKDMINWSDNQDHQRAINYKLYQLQQTSPSILFYQKIQSKEYGEAILLANKFGLDKNEVYKAQWNLNNSHISAVNDFLCKITDYGWVLDEIQSFIPPTEEFAFLLIDRGINITNSLKTEEENNETGSNEDIDKSTDVDKKEPEQSLTKSEIEMKETYLLNTKLVLTIYSEILSRDRRSGETGNNLQFDGALFKVLCSLTIVQIGILFAKQGVWTALDVLMTQAKTRPIVDEYWLVMLSCLPETLSPRVYADVLPELLTKPPINYTVDLEGSIESWCGDVCFTDVEAGYWDEEELEGLEWDMAELPCTRDPARDLLDIPELECLLGPMTPRTVYLWYKMRSDKILTESGLFDNAQSLLELGIERLVPLDQYLIVLELLESAVCQLHFKDTSLGSLTNTPFSTLLFLLLHHCPLEDKVGQIVDIYIPFITKLEVLMEGSIYIKDIVQECVVTLSSDGLLPLLQLLQSQELNQIVPETEEVHFAGKCFEICTKQKNWMSIAKEISELLNNDELQLKLDFFGYVIGLLGPKSPHFLFGCLEDEEQYTELLDNVLKESFKKKELKSVKFIKDLTDKKIVDSTLSFKLVFERCLEVGDLAMLEQVITYRQEGLSEEIWQGMVHKYSELYLKSAPHVDHPYIAIVVFLIETAPVLTPPLTILQTRISILEDMRELGVMLNPRQIEKENKEELVWRCISFQSNNFLQEKLLLELSIKLGVNKAFTLTKIAEIAYQNSSFGYCKQICTKAIHQDYKEIVPVCVKLLKNTDFADIPFKEMIFNFSVKYVDPSQIDGLLDLYHKLPSYLDGRKRKFTECGLNKEELVSLKIQRYADLNEIMDQDETISNESSLEELYYWLLGRSVYHNNAHIDKVDNVRNVIEECLSEPVPQDVKVIANKISNILQGNILKELHGNINVPRFTYDKAYRGDVIRTLAECETIELALSLGRKYGMDMWDLHFNHYQWIIRNEKQVPEQTSTVLRSDPDRLAARCGREIYPAIPGSKYNVLVTYYTLLGDTANLRVVNKIRAAIPGLDYKEFLQAGSLERLLEILAPLLNNGNVHVISKLGPNIHPYLTKSAVFYSYSYKLFFCGEGKQSSGYETRWSRVKDMLQFLESCDLDKLITSFCLSSDSGITFTLRCEMCRNNPNLKSFFKLYNNELFEKYKDSYFQTYLKSYEHSHVFDIMAMAMLLDSTSSNDVAKLLSVRNVDVEQFVDATIKFLCDGRHVPECLALQEEIQHLIQFPESELFEELLNNGEALLPQQTIIDKLKEVCSLTSLRPGILESTISALEKHLTAENDTEMIVFFKTKPLVDTHWGGRVDIQPGSVLSDGFYRGLCEGVGDVQMCGVLFEIIKLWGVVETRSVWVEGLLQTISRLPESVETEGTLEISTLLSQILGSPCGETLFEDTILKMSHLFTPPLSHIIILSSPHPDLIFDIIPDLTLADLENATLLDLVIRKDVYLQLVNTELYPVIASELTRDGRTLEFVKDAATKLRGAGNVVEALSLVAQFTESSYGTFSYLKSFMSWE